MRAGLTDRLAPGASFALVALLIVFALRGLRHASDMWILPVENALGKISAEREPDAHLRFGVPIFTSSAALPRACEGMSLIQTEI